MFNGPRQFDNYRNLLPLESSNRILGLVHSSDGYLSSKLASIFPECFIAFIT